MAPPEQRGTDFDTRTHMARDPVRHMFNRGGCFMVLQQLGRLSGLELHTQVSLAAAAHARCCGLENASGYFSDSEDGRQRLKALHGSMQSAEEDRPGEDGWRSQHSKARRWLLGRPCWLEEGHTWEGLVNPGNCCLRPMIDVDIVVAGFAKAGTSSVLQLLSTSPNIVTAEYEEVDAFALAKLVTVQDVMQHNLWARAMRASKPGASLLAVSSPSLAWDQKKMWRLAQIPGVRIVVALREPTEWLASAYNYFVVKHCDLHRSPIVVDPKSAGRYLAVHDRATVEYCRRHEDDSIPSWRDVALSGVLFSKWDLQRIHADFAHHLKENVRLMFPPQSVAYIDLQIIQDGHIDSIQSLASFLGAVRHIEVDELKKKLEELSQTRGGHALAKKRMDVVSCCDGSLGSGEEANGIFRRAREDLRAYLLDAVGRGSFVAITSSLLSEPCADGGGQA